MRKRKKTILLSGVIVIIVLAAGIGIYMKVQDTRYRNYLSTAGRAYQDGAYDAAETDYRSAIDMKSRNSEGYLGLADSYIASEKFDEADALIEEAFDACGNLTELSDKQVDIDAGREAARLQHEYEAMIEEAQKSMDAADYDQVIQLCDEAVASIPENEDAYYLLADAYLAKEEFHEAYTILRYDVKKADYDEDKRAAKEEKYTALVHEHFSEILAQVSDLMNGAAYDELTALFDDGLYKSMTDCSFAYSYYYEDGKSVDKIASGNGMILSEVGVYMGEIENGHRQGQGLQFECDFDDEGGYTYYLLSGKWSNNMMNGTGSELIYSHNRNDSSLSFEGYEGNLKDNYFDGEMVMTWVTKDYPYMFHAGTINVSNGTVEDYYEDSEGRLIFVKSSDGFSIYAEDESELNNFGVWDGYFY